MMIPLSKPNQQKRNYLNAPPVDERAQYTNHVVVEGHVCVVIHMHASTCGSDYLLYKNNTTVVRTCILSVPGQKVSR